jgi:hypothetical protein
MRRAPGPRLPALARPQSGPTIRVLGSQVHEINTSIVFPNLTIIPRAVLGGIRQSMLKSKIQAVLLLCVLATCLAYYSFTSQRSDRLAKRLRLEEEYLSWDWKDTPEEILCQSNSSNIDREPIPRTVHFILIADEGKQADLEFYQYLAIKAALLRLFERGKRLVATHQKPSDPRHSQASPNSSDIQWANTQVEVTSSNRHFTP